MAYIKFGNQLLNTDAIYFVDSNPATLITINSKKGIQQISADEWDDIKGDLIACSNFKEIVNYGYVNLDLVIDVWKTDDNYYTIKFEDFTKNLLLSPENVEGIDETVFNEIKAYVKATGGGGGGGTTNYDALSSKPKINGKTLTGNKTAAELGLASKDELDAKANASDLTGKANTTALTTEITERQAADTKLEQKINANEQAIANKQDKLVAGPGIEIKGSTISSTAQGGTTYQAGNGINIAGDEIKIDENVVATVTALNKKANDNDVVKLNKIENTLSGTAGMLPDSKTVKDELDNEITNRENADKTLQQNIDKNTSDIGTIGNLGTQAKTLVEAINEIKDAQTQGGYTLPQATADKLGGVTIGQGIKVAGGQISTSKDEIGLDQVDNTSDVDKPISTLTQEALDLKANEADVLKNDALVTTLEDDDTKVPSSKAVKDALATAGKIAGATLDGQDVKIGADQKLEITLPKATETNEGIMKVGEGLKVITDGEVAIDENKVVLTEKIDDTDFTIVDDSTIPSSKLVSTKLEDKLDKVLPRLTNGEDYQVGQIAYQVRNGVRRLVRVTKAITNYNNDTDNNTITIIDSSNLSDYPLIRNFVEHALVRNNTFIFHKGSVYQAIVDVVGVQETDLTDTAKFTIIYNHDDFYSKAEIDAKLDDKANADDIGLVADLNTQAKKVVEAINEIQQAQTQGGYTLPQATKDVLGGVTIGDGLDVTQGKISIDKTQLPVLVYRENGQHIPENILVIHANNLYISIAEITTTTDWATDSANMFPVDTNTHVVDVIDYDTVIAGEEIPKGKIVVYQDKLYLTKDIISKVDWDTDFATGNLIETAPKIDLAEYYKQTQVDALLKNKADLVLPSIQNGMKLVKNQLALNGDVIVKVKEDIDVYDDNSDTDKLDNIGYLPVASDTQLGGIKVGDNLKIDQDGILSAGDTIALKTDLEDKATKIIPTLTVGSAYEVNELAITDKAELCRITTRIDSYVDETTDKASYEVIGSLPKATADTLGGVKVGNGLEVNDGTISVDTTNLQSKLVAGDGVKIEEATNTISAQLTQTLTDSESDIPSSKLVNDELSKKSDNSIPTLTATSPYLVGTLVKKDSGEVYKIVNAIDSYDEATNVNDIEELISLKNSKTLTEAIINLTTAFEDFKKNFAINTVNNTLFFTEDEYNGLNKEEGKLYIIKQ